MVISDDNGDDKWQWQCQWQWQWNWQWQTENGKWQMENGKLKITNGSGNVNDSGNGSGNGKGYGNDNECQVSTLYKQHEMKTLTILDFFLSAIILFAVSLSSLSLDLIPCLNARIFSLNLFKALLDYEK